MLYLIGYSSIRFFLEFLRPDPWKIAGFSIAGAVSLLFLITVPICYKMSKKIAM
jgi:prolipoprotein diacylglyceryltransferase